MFINITKMLNLFCILVNYYLYFIYFFFDSNLKELEKTYQIILFDQFENILPQQEQTFFFSFKFNNYNRNNLTYIFNFDNCSYRTGFDLMAYYFEIYCIDLLDYSFIYY